ncbi:hypothetical protein MKX08_008011 [Trichoderma sp. CBMAI-0020]|nr:hypothetical protein MKX08_008011 [Trichoderma sp. CBMAI-0020]WOD45576.1 hypothetical protein [Trichoderma atroviride]
MRAGRTSLALLCVVAEKFVQVSLATHVIHERALPTNDWVKLGNINPDGLLPVRIGLTQQNLVQGHDLLMERSTPGHPKYGQHMTQDEVIKLFAPHDDSVNAVQNWLESEGIKPDRVTRSGNLQWIQFHATVTELEKLTNSTYDIYEHQKTGVRHVGTDEYSIPAELKAHIDMISPAIKRMQISGPVKDQQIPKNTEAQNIRRQSQHNIIPAAPLTGSDVTNDCNKFLTPRCISNMYRMPLTSGNSSIHGNELGIFQLQPYNQSDLTWFYKKFAPHMDHNITPLFNSINGAPRFSDDTTANTTGDGQAMLDIQVAYPIVYPQRVRVFGVEDVYYQQRASRGLFNNFLDAIDGSYCNFTAFNITGDSPKYDPSYPDSHGYIDDRMCGVFTPTNVISISYSPEEAQQSANYDRRQCTEWMKLGLMGVTVVGSSGVYGVAGNDAQCLHTYDTGDVFNPLSLTNCPYVLAVGSTQLAPGVHDGSQGFEVGLQTVTYSSGGGFSNIYEAPAYQKSTLDAYWEDNYPLYLFYNVSNNQSLGQWGGLFNIAGRGIPDISAIGANMVTIDQGDVHTTSAKSGAAPLIGAIITRINEERLKANMSTVAFINPALYANTSIFNDVIVGNGTGCGGPGFQAVKGWDPVTGLGTPDYPSMLEYFLSIGRPFNEYMR